jgi:hypothetical protein
MTTQQIIDFIEEILEFLQKLLSIWPVKLFAGKTIKEKQGAIQTRLNAAKTKRQEEEKTT